MSARAVGAGPRPATKTPTRRVLYVTPEPPSRRGGGGLHCYANLRALCAYPGVRVDYVGPRIEERLPGLDRLRTRLARSYRFGDKIHAAATRAATSLAGLFREMGEGACRGYDLAFVEFSKSGFVFQALTGVPMTICSVHNVEVDYARHNSRGWSRLAAAGISRSEATSLRRCDRALVMHRDDLARLNELYAVPDLGAKAHLHPVCAAEPLERPLAFSERERVILVPGTLCQRFNERGIVEFIDECWPKLHDARCRLVVAGREPRPLLKRVVRRVGATLVENPDSMAAIVRRARLVVVPDLGGTGMKLRVAEALSLGVPVVGTSAGLRGYADAPLFGRVVGTIAEMAPAIRELAQDDAVAQSLGLAARDSWERHYNYDVFAARLHGWLGSWLEDSGAGTRPAGERPG